MIAQTLLHQATDMWLALDNPTPEAPPGNEKLMRLVRYLTWFVLLSGMTAIVFGGGKFAWEKWHTGAMESPKMIGGAMIGGVIATTAGSLMTAAIG